MEVVSRKADRITDMKDRMRDIYLNVSWREIARTYFDKSVPWFQHKMYGIDGNGGIGGFAPEEAEQLRDALVDLSDRIRRAGYNIAALNTSRHRVGWRTYKRLPVELVAQAACLLHAA